MKEIPPKTRPGRARPIGKRAKASNKHSTFGYFTPRSDGAYRATSGPNKGKRVAKRDYVKDKSRHAKTASKPGYDYRGDRKTRRG